MGDKITEEKNERVRAEVLASKSTSREKEEALELIAHAENICNGGGSSLEANSRALGALIRYTVRRSLAPPSGDWKWLLIQCRWPLAAASSIGFFSPHFGHFLDCVDKVVK